MFKKYAKMWRLIKKSAYVIYEWPQREKLNFEESVDVAKTDNVPPPSLKRKLADAFDQVLFPTHSLFNLVFNARKW